MSERPDHPAGRSADHRRGLGLAGERIAAARLESEGLRVVARNARTRFGEIDLIALDGEALAFVEVKTLASGARGGPERPALGVGPSKRLRLRRLAAAWLGEHRSPAPVRELRFDVIGLRIDPAGRVTEYEHIRGAF